jgi:hypothetical protein
LQELNREGRGKSVLIEGEEEEDGTIPDISVSVSLKRLPFCSVWSSASGFVRDWSVEGFAVVVVVRFLEKVCSILIIWI